MSVAAAVARLVASLEGAGFVFVRLAAFAVLVLGVAGAIREGWRWYASFDEPGDDETAPTARAWAGAERRAGVPPRDQHALASAPARHRRAPRRRETPHDAVLALARSGASAGEIARRTGLSRDAVALLLALHR